MEIPCKARHQVTQKHHVIIHVEEVTDPSNGITLCSRTRRLQTWPGKVDGTGEPLYRTGAHKAWKGQVHGAAGGSDLSSVKTEFSATEG